MVIAGNCTSGGGYLARLAFQFIPESFCENSMIMSADETCRKNGFTAEDLIALAVESHKNAAKFIEVISPLTLPVVGLEKGRRNKAFNFSKDYWKATACSSRRNHKRSHRLPFQQRFCFYYPCRWSHCKKTIVTLHLMKTLEHFDEHYGIASVPSAGEIASAILLERIKWKNFT